MAFESEKAKLSAIKTWHFLSPGMKAKYLNEIRQIEETIAEQELRITVFGEFSTGKSTFLNALIGKDILPHETTETTATITYIHNVPKDDERANSIIVDFVDERESIRSTLNNERNALQDYLTTKSKVVDVATTVRSVHIYCHMFDSAHRMTLVDTPGLNGMTEHHRNITIEELRRSHISICMFSQKGLTESEVFNLQELLKYQQEFILVMNFLDRLDENEGDTLVGHLDMLKKQVAQFVPEIEAGEENTFFISALYALAGRDNEVKRLYHGDETDLTPERRRELLNKSGIIPVEKYIKTLSEEKFASFLGASLHYKIAWLVKNIAADVGAHKVLADLSEAPDNRRIIREELDKRIGLFEPRKNELQAFLRQKVQSIVRAMEKRVDREQETWLESQIKGIDSIDIADAEAVQKLIRQVNELADAQNRAYREQTKDLLTAIYQDGILRADAYYPKIREVTEKKYSFEMGQQTDDRYSYTDQITRCDEQIAASQNRLEKARQAQAENDGLLRKIREQLTKAKKERDRLQWECERALSQMGSRPDVEHREVSRTREENRTFFGLFDLPFFTKTIEYTDTVSDTSRRDAWDEKRQRIQYESRGKIAAKDREIRRLKQQMERAEENNDADMVAEYQMRLEKAQQDKQDRIRENREFQEKATREFYRAERQRLIKDLRNFREKHLNALMEDIKKNFFTNEKRIWELVVEHYTKVYKEDIQRLQKLLAGEQETAVAVSVTDIARLEQEIATWNNGE